MGDSEYGTCEVCGKENHLTRTYYNYEVKCDCHSPEHFKKISHCLTCVPKEPEHTTIHLRTKSLKEGSFIKTPLAIKALITALEEDEAYKLSWVANIAMAFKDTVFGYNPEANLDEELIHKYANKAAERFINQLIKK